MNFRLSPDGRNSGHGLKNCGLGCIRRAEQAYFTKYCAERWWRVSPPSVDLEFQIIAGFGKTLRHTEFLGVNHQPDTRGTSHLTRTTSMYSTLITPAKSKATTSLLNHCGYCRIGITWITFARPSSDLTKRLI